MDGDSNGMVSAKNQRREGQQGRNGNVGRISPSRSKPKEESVAPREEIGGKYGGIMTKKKREGVLTRAASAETSRLKGRGGWDYLTRERAGPQGGLIEK